MEELSIGQQIVDKVSSLIQPCFFDGAQLLLQENTSLLDSIIIKIDNNPWRNGVIKGNAIFARIKSSGGNAYINVKDKFEEIFDTFGVVKLPVPESESKYDWIRIELQSFLKLLNDPSHDFIQAINDMFVECIAFPSFGCCSKYVECTNQGKCLHMDQLYATACQYRKNINSNKVVSHPLENIPNKDESKGKSIIDFPSQYVVLDLETTGLSPSWDRIIEIGALKVKDGCVIDKYQTLIYPEREIDSFIEQLTGITNEMLSDAPLIQDVLPAVDKFIGDSVIVGHNTHFDVNFLHEDYLWHLHKPFSNNFVDNIRIARKVFPELEHHRLSDVVEALHIESTGFHRAFSDCDYTFQCYEQMKQIVIEKMDGIENFKKLFKKKSYKGLDLKTLVAETDSFDEDHPLFGKVCVFTGTLQKYTRKEAAQIVVNFGGLCENRITQKTNLLIMGNNDYCAAIKDGKSTKQKKAEEYKLKGQDIEIIPESVFYDMIGSEES